MPENAGYVAEILGRAQIEARRAGHDHVGTEHLLLGLLEGENAAADALSAAGVTPAAARTKVARLFPMGDQRDGGELPSTRRADWVVRRAVLDADPGASAAYYDGGEDDAGIFREAERVRRERAERAVRPEHLLRAILTIGEGGAVRVLRALGVDPYRLQTVIRAPATPAAPEESIVDRPPPSGPPQAFEPPSPLGPYPPPPPPPPPPRFTPPPPPGPAFTALPDDELSRLLMAAGGRALSDGRGHYTVQDVLDALGGDRRPTD